MSVANDALAAVRKGQIGVRGKRRIEFDLNRPCNQPTSAGSQNFGERIIDFVFLSERDDSILVHGVTLFLGDSGGLSPTPLRRLLHPRPGLEKALAALWSDIPVQRCTVHKHRNLLAHAPDRLHEEISADYKDMVYAHTKQEIKEKRKAFIRKWRLKCAAVAVSLEEAGDKLFTFTRFPKSQWKSIRTSNAVERLHEEFKRRIKTQTVLPSAETAAMLFWALLASGQITMRRVDGWQSLNEKPSDQIIDLAA